jgi:flavodoxin
MKILIVYDSLYGNTEKVAHAMAESLQTHEVSVTKADHAGEMDLSGVRLIIAGSPTHGGRPSPRMKRYLGAIGSNALKDAYGAEFDTGIPRAGQKPFIRFVVRLFGYADKHIARALAKKGAHVTATETFFVLGKEGPLMDGELERAKRWAVVVAQQSVKT